MPGPLEADLPIPRALLRCPRMARRKRVIHADPTAPRKIICANAGLARSGHGSRQNAKSFLDAFLLTIVSLSGTRNPILLTESRGALLETIPEAEQVRFPRARLVTLHSGGLGIDLPALRPAREVHRCKRDSKRR
jgi:hypothetical protein